jgi:hypothetical protein
LQARFGSRPLIVCEQPENLAAVVHRLREGQSLWEIVLAAVLVGLLVEAFLANSRSRKQAGAATGAGTIPAPQPLKT